MGNRIEAMSAHRAMAAAGALLAGGIGLLFYLATAWSVASDSKERFNGYARHAQYMIETRLQSYGDVLRSSASMFNNSGPVTRAQFHRYVSGLDLGERHPSIETINFARHVGRDELPALVAEMLAQDKAGPGRYPPFRLKPQGERDAYDVLVYIEPVEAWGDKYGYDISSRPAVARANRIMCDTGLISTSGTPLAVLKGPNPMGLGMRAPVYRAGMPLHTAEQRRSACAGSVGIGFSVPKLVQGVLDEMQAKHLRLTLKDAATGALLFDSAATGSAAAPPPDGDFFSVLPVRFNGRTWSARFSIHARDAYTGFDAWFPWLAGTAGFALAALLWALFQALASSRWRAIRLARAMTRELRESQQKLQLSHQTLRRLAAHADQIKEDERKRIAREIHDDLGQNLLALRIDADMLATLTAVRHPRLNERARGTVEQIDSTIRSVRNIINDLRPNVLDLGLSAAVEWLVADFRRHTGIACEVVETRPDIELNDQCATALFRILQESLSNIRRHANATHVRVELVLAHGILTMNVADNGCGMRPGARDKADSFGLVGIEERIKILNGTLSIRSHAGAGTTVSVALAVGSVARPADGGAAAPMMAGSENSDTMLI